MKSTDEMEKLLTRLGSEWPVGGSIVDGVMQTIQSSPPRANLPQRRAFLVKSLLAAAVSLAACLTLWWAIPGSPNLLYAQVIEGARKARTIHMAGYVQVKGEAVRILESWYESGVGFRRDTCDRDRHQRTTCVGNEDSTWTLVQNGKKTAVRCRSRGIAQETEQIFADIAQHALDLQNSGRRDPQEDQTFDGRSCKAYVSRTGERRDLYYLDPQSRLVRVVAQERDGDHWNTLRFHTIEYDQPLKASLLEPNFGDGVKIVDNRAQPAAPDRPAAQAKPQGAVLLYEVDPTSKPANVAAIDMDQVVRVVDARLNAGAETVAAVRRLDHRRIEVALMRREDADRQCVERRLIRPGTLEFRVLANPHTDRALIDRAQNSPASRELLDPTGKRLAWWVPVRAGSQDAFQHADIARRSKQAGDRQITEALVVADPYNITGAYLTHAKLQFDRSGNPSVGLTFNDVGGELIGKITGDHLPNASAGVSYMLGILVDGELYSAPTIRSRIGSQAVISGSFTEMETSDLAAVLNAGSLPVRLRLIEQRSPAD